MVVYSGKSVFGGIAIGKICVYAKEDSQVKRERIEDPEAEIKRYHEAKDVAIEQLGVLYEKALKEVGEDGAGVFEAHQMMLDDGDYIDSVENIIRTQSVNAEYAVAQTGDQMAQMFLDMEDEYFRGRAADVHDISERLIGVLSGKGSGGIQTDEQVIIVADDLAPSETVQMDKDKILSFVTVHGSANSHTSILAKTMNIPAMIGCDIPLDDTVNGKMAVVDGFEGKVYIEPDEETMAAKKKFVDHDNWTLDELIEIYDNLPEGTKLFRNSDTKEGVFHNLTNGLSSFVDMDTNSCSFDSDEFIKVLEFANRFPDEEEGEPDWDNASQDEMDKYYAEQQNACRNDKALVSEMSLFSIREYAQLLHGEFGEDISLVGFPSDDGKGGSLTLGTSFSILSDTANKEACWQFISTFFSDDAFSKDSYSMGGIPALKTKFAEMLDSAMDRPYWEDENGKKQYYDDTYWIGDNEEPVKIDPLTQEQRDYIEEYILNCCSGSIYINDEDIRSIVQEEIKSYFAGEKSASDTAANIQNRVSLLLSEQG